MYKQMSPMVVQQSHDMSPRYSRRDRINRRELRTSANSATQIQDTGGNINYEIEDRIYVAPSIFNPHDNVNIVSPRHRSARTTCPPQRQSQSTDTQMSAAAQHPTDVPSIQLTLDAMLIFHPPPIDEDTRSDETPPYQPTLHRYLDLMSFDPRYAPVLRINKRLINSPNKLKESIKYFKSCNLIPDKVNLWNIQHVDDSYFDDIIPEIMMSSHGPSTSRSSRRRHNPEILTTRSSSRFEDDEEQLQYALFLSTLEANSQRRTNYSGFRYRDSVPC